jgi:hypothetical protein
VGTRLSFVSLYMYWSPCMLLVSISRSWLGSHVVQQKGLLMLQAVYSPETWLPTIRFALSWPICLRYEYLLTENNIMTCPISKSK